MTGKSVRARMVTGAALAVPALALLAVAPPAHAAAGIATVTDLDAAGHVVGQQFSTWLDTAGCYTSTLTAGTVGIEVANGTLTTVEVYDDPACGGTPIDVVHSAEHKTIALPLGDGPVGLIPVS